MATANPRKLTAAVQATIVASIEGGGNYRDAALCAGISESGLRLWRAAGEKAKSGKLHDLVAAISEAYARRRARLTVALDKATTGVRTVKRRHVKQKRDPVTKEVLFEYVEEWTEEVLPDGRLILELLTRLDPEHYARRDPEPKGSEKAFDDIRKLLGL